MKNLNNREGDYSVDSSTVAYKDGICYPVEISSKAILYGMCIGRIRTVTIDNNIVATFTPMSLFSSGYQLLYIDNISEMRTIIESYDNFKNKLWKNIN